MGVDTFVSWKYWNHLRWLQEKKPYGHIKCRAIARAGQGTTKGRHRKDIYQRIFISYPISKNLQKGYFLSFFGAGYLEDIIAYF
jgi:hypothetical protein